MILVSRIFRQTERGWEEERKKIGGREIERGEKEIQRKDKEIKNDKELKKESANGEMARKRKIELKGNRIKKNNA